MIILNILKIIGIILALIIGIILLLLFLVLFCPIHYQIKGYEKYISSSNDMNIKVKLSWLFNIIGFNILLDSDISMYIRLLFFKIKLKNKSNNENEDKELETSDNSEASNNSSEENSASMNSENVHYISSDDKDENKDEKDNDNYNNVDSNNNNNKLNIKNKFDKLKSGIDKFQKVKNNHIYKSATYKIKDEFIKLLKAILPHKLFLKVKYSLGSPDYTGISLGILAMFPIGYKNRWQIKPDFDSEEIFVDSSFNIKGHIFIFKIIGIAIRLLIDKNCRKLYNYIRK